MLSKLHVPALDRGKTNQHPTMDLLFGDHSSEEPILFHDLLSSSASVSEIVGTSELRESKVIIGGAGPCGVLTAILLNKIGFSNVKIFEKRGDPLAFLSVPHFFDRKYVFQLDKTSQLILSFIDTELFANLKKLAVSNDHHYYYPSFMKELLQFAVEKNIQIMYNHEIIQVKCTFYSTCEVYYRNLLYNYGDHQECSSFLICTGKHSKLISSMSNRNSNIDFLTFKNRKRLQKFVSLKPKLPSPPLFYKHLTLSRSSNAREVIEKYFVQGCDTCKYHNYHHCTKTMKGIDFNMCILPNRTEDQELNGGILASIILPEEHRILQVENIEDVKEFVKVNFSELGVALEELIDIRSLESFHSVEEIELCSSISYSRSFMGRVKQDGIILLMGDSAHSFPYQTDFGMNCIFQDVITLYISIKEKCEDRFELLNQQQAVQNVIWYDIGSQYEKMRFKEVRGLAYILSSLNNSVECTKTNRFKTWVDKMLNRLVYIYPSLPEMVSRRWSFSVIERRNTINSLRLQLLSSFFIVLLSFLIQIFISKGSQSV